jgi:hypothetical protein
MTVSCVNQCAYCRAQPGASAPTAGPLHQALSHRMGIVFSTSIRSVAPVPSWPSTLFDLIRTTPTPLSFRSRSEYFRPRFLCELFRFEWLRQALERKAGIFEKQPLLDCFCRFKFMAREIS